MILKKNTVVYRYRGYAPRARASVFLVLRFEGARISRIPPDAAVTHKIRQHYKHTGLRLEPVVIFEICVSATARLFLTPHAEHRTNLKNIRKVNVHFPASYYAIRY